MSSPNLNVVTLLGSSLTYGSAYFFGIEKQNPLSRPSMEMLVQMRICLLCIGGSLAFGPILGKSWRLYKVFTQRVPDKRVIIKDLQLLVMVVALAGADIVLLSTWIFLDPVQCLPSFNAELKVTEKDLTCVVHRGYFCTSLYSDLWLILFLGFKGILLMYGAYLAGLTYDVSYPPLNQSLTLIVGIAVIFLSAEITLVVNRFFYSWHNLVFGVTSGGIFFCTTTINCLIFTPQVRQWKTFENQNEDLSQVAKYFTCSSKTFHSTVYSEEEICQLLGEKHAMMQLLAEKDTAIASLQEQVNRTKEKLTRLVASEGVQEAGDSLCPSISPCPQDCSAASALSGSPEDTPTDRTLPSQEQNSWQYYPLLSNSQCMPGSSYKNHDVSDLECTSRRRIPPDITDTCRLLSSASNISGCSHDPNSHHRRVFQDAAPLGAGTFREPLRENFYTPRAGPERPQFWKQLPGVSYVGGDKLQEAWLERSMDHKAGSPASPRGPEQSAACGWSTRWWPQEIQANALTGLGPYETRPGRKILTCLPGAQCIVNRTICGMQRGLGKVRESPWVAAVDAAERCSLHQPCSFSSSVYNSKLHYRAENWSEHPNRAEKGWLLEKHPPRCSGSPATFRHRSQDFAMYAGHLYSDFDSGSSTLTTTSSEGGVRGHHSCCCEHCRHSLSSSSGSCSTEIESGLSGRYCTNPFGKPQPVVNFNDDLEPTFV